MDENRKRGTMQVTVFGASGKVGRRVVEAALKDGHTVIAFVHRHNTFQGTQKLIVMQGDIRTPHDVEAALHGSKAVISCLGSWGRAPKDVLSAAMSVIIPEMKAAHIKRIISLTGSDALATDEKVVGVRKVIRLPLKLLLGKILHDGEQHMRMLGESGLDWTVLRSPPMNNIGRRRYRLTLYPLPLVATIRRQAVADALVALLKRPKTIGKSPFISRK